eukprot:1002357-Pelagomonas_calceolata.AAC.1
MVPSCRASSDCRACMRSASVPQAEEPGWMSNPPCLHEPQHSPGAWCDDPRLCVMCVCVHVCARVRGYVQAEAVKMVMGYGAPLEVEVGDLGQEEAASGVEQASGLVSSDEGLLQG